MEFKQIDFPKVALKVLELIIVKPITLPLKIYTNALFALSNTDAKDSEENNLNLDFPLYIWLISIFDAIIVIIYPIGIIAAILGGINSYRAGFAVFIYILLITYFSPLIYGLIRELAQISLKVLLYLKLIVRK
ncbi:hypothetical protein GTQ40_13420 [Flavobacteriaceae bacterium R38]|nr:hypothetical protein [Flavobacteriaceae bacterium R38]